MNVEWTITAGQILVIAVPIVSGAGAIVLGFLFNKWKKETLLEVDARMAAQKISIEEKATERQDAVLKAIADTNERLTRYAEGASTLRTELGDFKVYADKHFVEVGDLAEVKASFQASMSDLRDDVRTATATMGDVRDAVIAATATGGKPTVPPARRRSTKAA